MITKTIGPTGRDYTTISACIAGIITETSDSDFTEAYTISIDAGTYAEFAEFYLLKPTATYGLYIQKSGTTKPAIDGSGIRNVCATIGSYTDITGMQFTNPIQIGLSIGGSYNNVYGNECYICNQGVNFGYGNYNDIHNNAFVECYGQCISLTGQYINVYDNIFTYSLSWGGSWCVASDGNYWGVTGHHFKIYNNIFTNNGTRVGGVSIAGASHHAEIYNNTFVGLWNNIVIDGSYGVGVTDVTIKNNLVYADGASKFCISVDAYSLTNLITDYNDFYYVNTAICGTYSGTTCNTLADWKLASSQDTNSITGDPLFYNNYSDLHLKPGSPCIGIGADLSAIFTTDYDGKTRTVPYDLGALKYTAPINLSVVLAQVDELD